MRDFEIRLIRREIRIARAEKDARYYRRCELACVAVGFALWLGMMVTAVALLVVSL